MAKILKRERQGQRDPPPPARGEAERLFAESAAAGPTLESALKDIAVYEQEIGTATEKVGRRLAKWSWLEGRAWSIQSRAVAIARDWLRFHSGRNAIQRMLRISGRLASRIDETAETARQHHQAIGKRITSLHETVAAAEVALVRTNIRQVIAAGRAAYSVADRQAEVVKFVGKITRATNGASGNGVDQHYRTFEGLLEHDYRLFASRESYPKEADAYAILQGLFTRMGEIRLAPRLASRNICAVAGGFSSGKSTFLNALMADRPEGILPTQITPTTSIPTYIFHVDDPDLTVNAFNHHGGRVKINADMFQRMTHSFKRDHGIELKRLVHRVAIYTPKLQSWRRLALIDTPGYSNPEGSAVAGERDEDIALASVLDSHFLIWVVDCDSGTIPAQDLQFIRKFLDERGEAHKEKSLYLVLNKGDKKTAQERKDILKQAEDTAKKHAIPFAGMGVYSSHDVEWYVHEGLAFPEFLERVDRAQSSRTSNLANTAGAVFQQYIDYHEQEADQLGKASGLLNRLALALSQPEDGSGKLATDLQKRRAYLRKMKADHESLREEAQQLQERFTAAATAFVEGINAMNEVGTAPPE